MHLLALLILCSVFGVSQSTIDTRLNSGTDAERATLLSGMGVSTEIVDAYKSDSQRPQLTWLTLQSATRPNSALLFLPCRLDSAYLYLMKQTDSGWRVVDRSEFDCHYDGSVSISTVPGRQLIFVHRAGEGHGTGFMQQNFKVIDVADGKLRVVLNAEEVKIASRTPLGSYDLNQNSTFVLLPASSSDVIEETRSVNLNGRLKVERRYFRWSERDKQFLAAKFSAVVVR